MENTISSTHAGPSRLVSPPAGRFRSEIAYAVSDKPAGPYQHVNVALPPRGTNPATGEKYWDADVTHNANAFFHNGKYYLYYMGNYGDGKNYPMHRNHQRIGVAIAENPAGPWKRLDHPSSISPMTRNPSIPSASPTPPPACVRMAVSCSFTRPCNTSKARKWAATSATASRWPTNRRAHTSRTPGHIFEAEKPGKHWMVAEDPFIWFSRKYGNRYYAVTRDVVGTFTGSSGGICLFQSEDGLNWKPAAQPKVLESRFALEDGT